MIGRKQSENTDELSAVDLARPFLPEKLTPLFHTNAYAALTTRQRLRYNQLQGLYFNEQIAFFESAIARNVLDALATGRSLSRLSTALQQFAEEERRHTEMFRRLNRRAAPQLYAGRDFHFVRVPRAWAVLLGWTTRHPRVFPLFAWLMLLQEERSLYYSREMIRHGDVLDPQFVAVHRAHLADEVDHVRWDEDLLIELWQPAGWWRRHGNACLFHWMVGEFFNAPKRAQVRVVEELVCEHPEMNEQLPELRRQLVALGRDAKYQNSLYSHKIVPRTLARLDAWPEFHALAKQLTGEGR